MSKILNTIFIIFSGISLFSIEIFNYFKTISFSNYIGKLGVEIILAFIFIIFTVSYLYLFFNYIKCYFAK